MWFCWSLLLQTDQKSTCVIKELRLRLSIHCASTLPALPSTPSTLSTLFAADVRHSSSICCKACLSISRASTFQGRKPFKGDPFADHSGLRCRTPIHLLSCLKRKKPSNLKRTAISNFDLGRRQYVHLLRNTLCRFAVPK